MLAFRAYTFSVNGPEVHHAVGHRRRIQRAMLPAYFHRALRCRRSERTASSETRSTPRRWRPPARTGTPLRCISTGVLPVLAFKAYRCLGPDIHHAVGYGRRGPGPPSRRVFPELCSRGWRSGQQYTLLSSRPPTYTTPLATAGEEVDHPVTACHFRTRSPTVLWLKMSHKG